MSYDQHPWEREDEEIRQAFAAKDAEIERLKKEHVKMFAAYDKLEQEAIGLRARPSNNEFCDMVDRKDAEIERLKEHVEDLEKELLITVRVCNENVDLTRLITELADALVTEELIFNEDDDLIRRAREATR